MTKQETVEKEGRYPTTLSTKSREQMLKEAKTFSLSASLKATSWHTKSTDELFASSTNHPEPRG